MLMYPIYTPETLMRLSRLVTIACVVLLLTGCRKPATTRSFTHVVNLSMDGLTLGDEHATSTVEGQRITTEMRTTFSGPPEVRLEGRLVIERGRPTSLRVIGKTPPSLPVAIDVTMTPDRTDVFPVRAPFPVHLLSALVRQSVVSARRRFNTVPEGAVTIAACEGRETPFPDSICHAITGLSSGPALVWIDERQQLAAAVVRAPFGVVIATTPDRDDTHAALLKRFDIYSAR
jgi:hypothetical protein